MFASQSDLTQRHLIFLFQPLGHMGWSVRQCWLMNRSYSHSIQLVYNIIRNGSTWQKNRGLPLIFLLHPNILYATYATIYIYTRIYPPIKSKHIPLFKSFWSNQPISAHTPNNPVQFLVVKSLLSAQFESIFLTLSAHLFIQN